MRSVAHQLTIQARSRKRLLELDLLEKSVGQQAPQAQIFELKLGKLIMIRGIRHLRDSFCARRLA